MSQSVSQSVSASARRPEAAGGCSDGLTRRGQEERRETEGHGGRTHRGHGEGPGVAPGGQDRGLADSAAASAETSAGESQSVFPTIRSPLSSVSVLTWVN